MEHLAKMGTGNAPPLTKENRIVVAENYNTLVDKINEIINTITYVTNLTPTYTTYVDPDTLLEFRSGIRGSIFVVDKAISVLGFEGTEDVDWENIFSTT